MSELEQLKQENESLKLKLSYLYLSYCFAYKTLELNVIRQTELACRPICHDPNCVEPPKKEYKTKFTDKYWFAKAKDFLDSNLETLPKILPKTLEELSFVDGLSDDVKRGLLGGKVND